MSVSRIVALSCLLAAPAYANGPYYKVEGAALKTRLETAKTKLVTATRNEKGGADNRAHMLEVGVAAHAGIGVGAHFGIGVETKNGKSRLVARTGLSLEGDAVGVQASASSTKYRAFDPGDSALRAVEWLPSKTNAKSERIITGKGEFANYSMSHEAMVGSSEEKSVMVGAMHNLERFQDDSHRVSVKLPLSFGWKSKRLRTLDKHIKDTDRAFVEIEHAQLVGSPGLLAKAHEHVEQLEKAAE